MKDIVLVTANAKYAHTAFGLRSLLANMGTLASRSALLEFTIKERPADMLERILDLKPQVVLLSVYIWNEPVLYELASMLKAIRPELPLIMGGPEVSFKADLPRVASFADYIVGGEGEAVIQGIVERALGGDKPAESPVFVTAPPPELQDISLPYHLYSDEDIAHRMIYVEASRGCPYGCEFCLSSLDVKVRKHSVDRLLEAFDILWGRGVRQFKFIDRALNLAITPKILKFFLDRSSEDNSDGQLFLHFELVPEQLPEDIFELLKYFPKGSVQLEAGIQTYDRETAVRIGRRQSSKKADTNICRLLNETEVHLHTDLVAGLPGESFASFAAGFNRLFGLGAQEIQVGILKRLRGAPIKRHDNDWGMVYRETAPYDILSNSLIGFKNMQRIKRFARYFDLVHNNGNFPTASRLLFTDGSAFESFMDFSDWLFERTGQTASIALHRLAELIFTYSIEKLGHEPSIPADAIVSDYALVGGRRLPRIIRTNSTLDESIGQRNVTKSKELPARQKRRV